MQNFASVSLLTGGPNWIAWIVLGALAGFITKRLLGGKEGFLLETILGIVGAVAASSIAGYFFTAQLTFFPSLLVAVLGAVVLVIVWRAVRHSSGHSTVL